MALRPNSGRAADVSGSARFLDPVTPDDGADLPGGVARALFVGVGGVVVVADARGVVVEIVSGDSQYHPVELRRVLATGTTADRIVALY
jgi:hypothetical protein